MSDAQVSSDAVAVPPHPGEQLLATSGGVEVLLVTNASPAADRQLAERLEVSCIFFLVDRNKVFTISGEDVEPGGIGKMKFHSGICPKSPPKLRRTMR